MPLIKDDLLKYIKTYHVAAVTSYPRPNQIQQNGATIDS